MAFSKRCFLPQIEGTPTTRIFHPNTPVNQMDSAYYGFDIPVKSDKEYYLKIILYNIGVVAAKKGNLQVDLNFPNIPVPGRDSVELMELFEAEPISTKYIAIIFDESGFSIGKRVIMDMSNYNEVLKVHRQGLVKNLLFG